MANDEKRLIVKAFCIGRAGLHIAKQMLDNNNYKIQIFGVDSDRPNLRLVFHGDNYSNGIEIGKEIFQGLGAANDPAGGRAAAEADAEKIRLIAAGSDIVILITGLGGGIGTGAALYIAEMLKDMHIFSIAVVSLPFSFESTKRHEQAMDGLKKMEALADIVVPIDLITIELPENISFPDRWKLCDRIICNKITEIETSIYDDHSDR